MSLGFTRRLISIKKFTALVFATLFIACLFTGRSNGQIINTIAGNGQQTYSGDGVPATSSALYLPQGVAVDKAGNVYIADTWNNRVRKVDITTGIISTYAGGGALIADGVPAIQTSLYQPIGIVVDDSANVFVTDGYYNRVRKILKSSGNIITVAGNGNTAPGFSGDGGPALQAEFFSPFGLALDDTGNVYITDEANNRVRKVEKSTGIINTIAGNGVRGYTGDNTAATSAEVGFPTGVAVDKAGNIYIAQFMNNVIRKVSASTGIITTIGGNGTAGFAGNGGLATNAEFNSPAYIALDDSDNIYIGDLFNAVVRKITAATGIVTTLAGDTTWGFSGDGHAADSAEMNEPSGVTVDACNNVYVAERGNNRVRRITVGHAFTTAFTASATAVCPGQQVTFTDTSNFSATNWNWSFYGGTPATSTVKNPVITYSTPGPYSVLLTAFNGCGSANETAVQYIKVGLQPTLNISPAPASVCQGQPLTLTASGATTYQWVGTSNTSNSITVNPANDTTYQLHTSNGTCSRDTTIAVTVNPLPPLNVTPQSPTYCFGTGAHFIAAGGTSYTWSPSTGLTATTGASVVANPSSTTTYTITASNSEGCTAVTTDVLTILPAPTISYNYSNNGFTVTFTTDSATGGVTTYSWNFGDSSGNVSEGASATHTYSKAGTYYSCLTVYNNSNCSYTRCQYIDLTKTGVQNISGEANFQLYPNPANKLLVVSCELLVNEIEITNLLGQILITQMPSVNSKQNVIDVSSLSPGVYLLEVKNNNGVGVKKFVKE